MGMASLRLNDRTRAVQRLLRFAEIRYLLTL